MTSCSFPRSRSTNFAPMNAAPADDTDISCHPPRRHDERMGRTSYAILLDKGMDRTMPESRSRPAWRIGAGSVSHGRISSPIDASSISRTTLPRCSLTVTSLMPKAKAICLRRNVERLDAGVSSAVSAEQVPCLDRPPQSFTQKTIDGRIGRARLRHDGSHLARLGMVGRPQPAMGKWRYVPYFEVAVDHPETLGR